MRIVSVPPFVPSVPDEPLPVAPPHAPAPRARDAPTAATTALFRRTCMPVLLGDADHRGGRLPPSRRPRPCPPWDGPILRRAWHWPRVGRCGRRAPPLST